MVSLALTGWTSLLTHSRACARASARTRAHTQISTSPSEGARTGKREERSCARIRYVVVMHVDLSIILVPGGSVLAAWM